MSWSGNMQCIVTNQTGGSITNLTVTHTLSGNVDQFPPPVPLPLLEAGAAHFLPLRVGSGGSDEWSLRFTLANGTVLSRTNKKCDVEDEDLNSGQAVQLNLLPQSQGFSIEMPVSSSCPDNYYDVG